MKTIAQHIAHARTKPHHVRRKIATVVAGSITALIALVWFTANIMTGSFALPDSSFAATTGGSAPIATTSVTGSQDLAGVGAAKILEDKNAPAHIEIVDTTPTAPTKQPAQTILPF